ncbi:MAG: uncharacterized protein KVP18_004000 [Porospora cf. gigantea A]|uniref:uncharacterized protein n=1 Tax=Porospora cf. gigantea A TaxID=2853593 RepID=UPI00355A1232|nr:MAG: hypothetical protein KVP18_004000 [Porospora cf. gigantea A]
MSTDSVPPSEEPPSEGQANLTADQAFQEAMNLRKDRKTEEACDAFSRALEAKIEEVGTEIHPALGRFYLYYGHGLLNVAENSSAVLEAGAGENTDERVAWDVLECASKCLEGDSEDMTLCLLRLADLLVLQGRLAEADEDYSLSLQMSERLNDAVGIRSALVSRGQTRKMNGDTAGALADFERACSVIEETMNCASEDQKADLSAMVEDINLEIDSWKNEKASEALEPSPPLKRLQGPVTELTVKKKKRTDDSNQFKDS